MRKELKKSQTSEVLKYLKTHKKGITSMEAFELFGATRLSAIIFNLRANGYDIGTIPEKTVTRYGAPTSYVRYVLKG
jgi:hypothetical protein